MFQFSNHTAPRTAICAPCPKTSQALRSQFPNPSHPVAHFPFNPAHPIPIPIPKAQITNPKTKEI